MVIIIIIIITRPSTSVFNIAIAMNVINDKIINRNMMMMMTEIRRIYSLVHLVVAKLEELISCTLLGLFKIRLLFQDRVRSHNFRF